MKQASEEDRGQRKPDTRYTEKGILGTVCDQSRTWPTWPKLDYASAVWDPFTEDNIRKLEAVQRRAVRFVCNSYRQTASVSSMLNELSWPRFEQRCAEARLGLFYHIVHGSVDIDATTLMTRSMRSTRKENEVHYTRHMTSKDCYKFSFIPRTIIQWNGIAETGDFNQYKSDLKSHDLTVTSYFWLFSRRLFSLVSNSSPPPVGHCLFLGSSVETVALIWHHGRIFD